MNRNTESHFSELPSVEIERSIFDRSHTHKTSWNVGEVIPIYISEILPGDSVKMDLSSVIRLQTLVAPILDTPFCDIHAWFVPNRISWPHWVNLCGENTSSAWVPSVTYQVPSISSPPGGFSVGTIADHFGLPVNVQWSNTDPMRPSAIPFRDYALIINEFWRDQNLTQPLNISTGDANQTGSNGTNYVNDVANGGMPFVACKVHDYFTSALPSPLKSNAPVSVPLAGIAPVTTLNSGVDGKSVWTYNELKRSGLALNPMKFVKSSDGTGVPSNTYVAIDSGTGNATASGTGVSLGSNTLVPNNLVTDLTSATSVTINELRLAFQLQKFYEKQARSGSRYIEVLRAHFNVVSPDARLQRPEYLGGQRFSLQIDEVTNTAQTNSDFLGDVGAKSVTGDIQQVFEKSFTEHGFLIITACVRFSHSYAQGMQKFWTRRNFEDFYWPVFANLGEMPVYQNEICATSANMANPVVFGYQEAWADYRYHPDEITSELRPGIPNTLASWHLGDHYTTAPTLSDAWIREDKTLVDRVLAVGSSVSNQLFGEFFFKAIFTRPMPVYSIPGLIDHN